MQYYLGVDGGGTKTEFVLTDSAGNLLKSCKLPGSNPNDCGLEQTLAILQQGIGQLCEKISREQISFYAGVAGVGSEGTEQAVNAALSKLGFGAAACSGDINNILAAGLGERAGAVAIMGTGCVAFGVNGGFSFGEKRQTYRVGGWGSLFDDGGSGWRMGRDVLAAVLAGFDGSGPVCPELSELVQHKLGSTVPAAIPRIYKENKDFIASFAPVAFVAAEQGDLVAKSILQSNTKQVAKLLSVVLHRLPAQPGPIPVVVAGGLTRQWQVLQPLLLKQLADCADGIAFELSPLTVRPVWGALLMAGLSGRNRPSAFFEN